MILYIVIEDPNCLHGSYTEFEFKSIWKRFLNTEETSWHYIYTVYELNLERATGTSFSETLISVRELKDKGW
jgi:hypothetical protein